METTGKRRWWQFGMKAILFLTLLVAVYFAGRSHRMDDLQRELQKVSEELQHEREALHEKAEALNEKTEALNAAQFELQLAQIRLQQNKTFDLLYRGD